jgi:hypothetical protein
VTTVTYSYQMRNSGDVDLTSPSVSTAIARREPGTRADSIPETRTRTTNLILTRPGTSRAPRPRHYQVAFHENTATGTANHVGGTLTRTDVVTVTQRLR